MSDNKLKKINNECHQLAYEVLKSTASWLEDPDNEIFTLLEEHDDSVNIAAMACVEAANILKKANLNIQLVSGIVEQKEDITVALDKLQMLANEFDNSNDPNLIKKASLLDEILLTVAADVEEKARFEERMKQKLAEIKNRKTATDIKDKKKDIKVFESNEAALSTRYCPDHPGEPVLRKGDGIFQCSLDGKIYNYNEGFVTLKGNKVPGSSVENQTKLDTFLQNPFTSSDTRENRQS